MIVPKPFKRIQTTDKNLSLIQSNIEASIASLISNVPKIISRVTLVAGTNLVPHGLGRNFLTWGWLRPSASTSISEGANPDPTHYLSVVASVPATVDLVVY